MNSSLSSSRVIASTVPVIAEMIPDEVHILYLKFTRESNAVSIRGTSDSRSGFLKLKQSLEQNDNFYDVYLPMSSVTQQTDIEFTISFKMKNKDSNE